MNDVDNPILTIISGHKDKQFFELVYSAIAAASENIPVLILSLTIDETTLLNKIISYCSGVDETVIMSGVFPPDYFRMYTRCIMELCNSPIYLDSLSDPDIGQLKDYVTEAVVELNVKLVIIDSISVVRKNGVAVMEEAAVCNELHQFSLENKISMLLGKE